MIEQTVCGELTKSLGELFTCSRHGVYQRIRTPFLYPDGDYIDLFCRKQDGGMTVSDLGETTRWLRMQSTSPKRSIKQQLLLQDAAQTHGVEFFRGMLTARSRTDEDLTETIVRVAQAALRVSDLWFTFRARPISQVTDDVAEFLAEKAAHFSRREKLLGRSGRTWNVDFHVRETEQSSLVNVLVTGTKSAARTVVCQVVAGWFDLSHLTLGPEGLKLISLVDDTVDVWTEEDFRLLDDISTVSRWSRSDEFLETLRHAA